MNLIAKLFGLVKAGEGRKPVFANFFSLTNRNYSKEEYYYGIVYSCVDAIASAVSAVDYGLFTENKDEKTKVFKHPALDLFNTPNPFQTGKDLLYLIVSHIYTAGAAYLYIVKNGGGKPAELWVLNPHAMQVVAGNNFIDGYVYTNPKGEKIPLAIDEVLRIMRPNPYNQLEGNSAIAMAKRTIEADISAQDFNKIFFQNGANPSGILSTENSLTLEQRDRIKEAFAARYEGIKNAHKTLILEGGLEYTKIQLSQKDMDFVNQRNLSRDEILSIFRVPKTIVAITDDVNRANAETSEYVFALRVVLPMLSLIAEKLNRFYLPLFRAEKLSFEFDNPVPEDKELELRQHQAAVNSWMTVNEVRAEEGLEPIEGGDEMQDYFASDDTPDSDTEDTDTEDDKEPQDEEKKGFSKDVRGRKYLAAKRRFIEEKERKTAPAIKQAFQGLIQDINKKEIQGVIKGLTANKKGVNDVAAKLIPDMDDFQGVIGEITFDYGKDAIEGAARLLDENFKIDAVKPDLAIKWLKTHSVAVAKEIGQTVVERAREIIARDLAEEITDLATIKQDLVDTLDIEAEWRAERIARTEMIGSYNQGAMEQYKASDVVEKVQWITAADPCDDCAENRGEVRVVGDAFPTGDTEPYVHPNCRCDIIPYFDK